MKNEYFSSEYEPANCSEKFEKDPAERKVCEFDAKQGEMASIRDSVSNEPAVTSKDDEVSLGKWIEQKRSQCSDAGNLGITLLVAIAAGPFAAIGAFMSAKGQWYGVLYVFLLAPVVEEILKQSGMIYLLEQKPYCVFSRWQFVFAALISASIFATIENVLYINLYVPASTLRDPKMFAAFRWTVCTALHLTCSTVASLGMIRVWKKQLKDGKAAELSVAFPYFAVAMAIHGIYNFAAIFMNRYFMKEL
jgi:hypothetical protein